MTMSTRRLAFLSVLAAGLGVVGGAAAWVLVRLIRLLTNLALFHEAGIAERTMKSFHPGWPLFVAAVVGALLISLLARWAPTIRGHGIPETMEAVLTKESRIPPRTALAKPISAAIAIGTGAPFGAEGPIIVTGGSLGSLLGQRIRVSASERKILLAAGAAAGMSAVFGAPLAAVVLAVELLLFELSPRSFVPLVVASSVAGAMHAALFDAGPLFGLAVRDVAGLAVLPAFTLLGVACGGLAIVIARGLFLVEAGYRRLPIDAFWHPVVGAVGFASVGLVVPRVLGVGYDAIGDVLGGRLAVGTVAALAAAKLLAWWLALGSGTSGGTLAPILLVGAGFGSVVGAGLDRVLPGPDIGLAAFAVVAMAATFGAAAQVPFTAIVFVFELTRDYAVLLPLMLAAVVADLVYGAVNRDSLMTEKLRRRGLLVTRHYGPDPFAGVPVSDIMTTDVVTLDLGLDLGTARTRQRATRHHGFPVLAADGVVVAMARPEDLVGDDGERLASLDLPGAHVVAATAPAQAALRVMVEERVDHLAVVDGDRRLLGICTRTDLLEVRRRQFRLEDRPPIG